MRHNSVLLALLAGATLISACAEQSGKETVERAFQDVNVIDDANLNEVMLTVGDPNEAVTYFQRVVKEQPKNVEFQRGLAQSLVRAKRYDEGAAAWQRTVALPAATNDDRVEMADALIRAGDWAKAEKTLTAIPPTNATVLRRLSPTANNSGKKQTAFTKRP